MLPLRSAVKREAQSIAAWPALWPCSHATPTLPALEGQATLSRFLHLEVGGAHGTSTLSSSTSDQSSLDHLIALHRYSPSHCPIALSNFWSFRTWQNGFLFARSHKSLGPLTPPRYGLHCPRSGFLNLHTIDNLGWTILCCGELSCAL